MQKEILDILQKHLNKCNEEIPSKEQFIKDNYANLTFVFQWTQELLSKKLLQSYLDFLIDDINTQDKIISVFSNYIGSMIDLFLDRSLRGPDSTRAEAILAYQVREKTDVELAKIFYEIMNKTGIKVDNSEILRKLCR